LRRSAALLIAAATLAPGVHAARAAEIPTDVANGILLVAKPELQDPNFRQTVVLITQPQPGAGPIGVIVNRPTDHRLRQLFPEIDALRSNDDRIYSGGPVQRDMVLFVFRSSSAPKAGLHVLGDLYLSGNAELLAEVLKRPEPTRDLRVYAGYAGWAPGQLQAEIELGGWVVFRAEPEIIFSKDPAAVWGALIARAGKRSTRSPEAIPAVPVAAATP